jgi:hypothetical protein
MRSPPAYRAPTSVERATVEHLLAVDVADAAVLRAQLATAQVRSGCDCGCPTIEIKPDVRRSERAASLAGSLGVIAEAVSRRDSQAHPAMLLLFARDGWLSGLEFVDADGSKDRWSVPPVDSWEVASPTEVPPGAT